jgi:hypothetical protein
VPLRKGTWDHDVRAMLAAHPSPGVVYICNPNNPTGTLTSRADIEWLLANKPKETVLLLDEAYVHISPSAVPCTDLVAQDKDLIVLRTFSKIYGMAGLRAGAAIARPDLLDKMKDWSAGAMPITGMVGATASLKVNRWWPSAARSSPISARTRSASWPPGTLNSSLGKQQVHDECAAARRRILQGHDAGEDLHRPRLARVAHLGACHRGHQGRNGQVQDRVFEVL